MKASIKEDLELASPEIMRKQPDPSSMDSTFRRQSEEGASYYTSNKKMHHRGDENQLTKRCFEYATPKNLYDGRPSLPEGKKFQTTDEFARQTVDDLGFYAMNPYGNKSSEASEDCLASNNGMSTYKQFDNLIGAEPLRRENFSPPFKTGRVDGQF